MDFLIHTKFLHGIHETWDDITINAKYLVSYQREGSYNGCYIQMAHWQGGTVIQMSYEELDSIIQSSIKNNLSYV